MSSDVIFNSCRVDNFRHETNTYGINMLVSNLIVFVQHDNFHIVFAFVSECVGVCTIYVVSIFLSNTSLMDYVCDCFYHFVSHYYDPTPRIDSHINATINVEEIAAVRLSSIILSKMTRIEFWSEKKEKD